MSTTGIKAALNIVTGFRAMCLRLRRSMVRASLSGADVVLADVVLADVMLIV
jgi:hypothetical protein